LTASELLLVCKVVAASQALGKKKWPDRVRKVKPNSIQLNLRVQKDMRESFSQRLAKLPLAIWLLCPSAWSTIRMIHLCHILNKYEYCWGEWKRKSKHLLHILYIIYYYNIYI
jgi:hypothetical protein